MKKIILYCITIFIGFKLTTFILFFLIQNYASEKVLEGFSKNTADLSDMGILKIILLIPICALIEEIIFRFIPFFLLFKFVDYFKSKKLKYIGINFTTIIVAVLTNIIFGYMHGNILNIFIQGFGGFGYSMIYLIVTKSFYENFYIDGIDNISYLCVPGLVATTILHSMWNIATLFLF